MDLLTVNLFCCLIFIVSSVESLEETISSDSEFVVRQTKYGNIRGYVSERLPGVKVEQFLGVPYAAPPVGNLRLEVSISTVWKMKYV